MRVAADEARSGGGGLALVRIDVVALGAAGLAQHPGRRKSGWCAGQYGQPGWSASLQVASHARYRNAVVPLRDRSSAYGQRRHREAWAPQRGRCHAAYLRSEGVPSEAILEDDAGSDTMETARHAAALLRAGTSLIVVNQWFHLPRAIPARRRLGVRKVSGDWPRWFEARDVYSFLREAVALPFYAIKPLDLARQPDRVGTSAR